MCGKLPSRGRGAFTLLEMMVSMAISSVILTVLLSFTVYTAKSFASMFNYVDLEQKSQLAVDSMLRDIRATKALASYGTTTLNGRTITNVLTFLDADDEQLTYSFSNNLLIRTKDGESTMLLTNVDYLCFQVFKRNPVATTFEQFPTSDAGSCKLVSVNWLCSRSVLGSRLNTESVQTAKIVLRKQ